jgi:hypothetical protein
MAIQGADGDSRGRWRFKGQFKGGKEREKERKKKRNTLKSLDASGLMPAREMVSRDPGSEEGVEPLRNKPVSLHCACLWVSVESKRVHGRGEQRKERLARTRRRQAGRGQ